MKLCVKFPFKANPLANNGTLGQRDCDRGHNWPYVVGDCWLHRRRTTQPFDDDEICKDQMALFNSFVRYHAPRLFFSIPDRYICKLL